MKILTMYLPDAAVLPASGIVDLTGTGAVPPIPPVVQPPPAPAYPPVAGPGQINVIISPPPPSGQIRPVFDANTSVAMIYIAIPKAFPYLGLPLNPNHTGQIAFAEAPGNNVLARNLIVYSRAGVELCRDVGNGNTAPTVLWCINNPSGYNAAGAQFNVPSSDEWFMIKFWNTAWSAPSNTLCDAAYPYRY